MYMFIIVCNCIELCKLNKQDPGMNGVIGHDSALIRLYWAGDNLGEWDESCYEACPWCRINRSICWPAVQRTTTVPRTPLYITLHKLYIAILVYHFPFSFIAIQGLVEFYAFTCTTKATIKTIARTSKEQNCCHQVYMSIKKQIKLYTGFAETVQVGK